MALVKHEKIEVIGATEHNLQNVDLEFPRNAITVVTGVSGSGKSSLVFDTVLAEANRRFFFTLSQYSRQFLDLGSRPSVRKVTGLSPAISLAQNETQPSVRATVGTLTDTAELVNVLFARFGSRFCPNHGLPTEKQSPQSLAKMWTQQHSGKLLAICVPIVTDKRGVFRKQMSNFSEKGYLKVYVDGEVMPLSPVPELQKEKKHTIKAVIDYVRANEKNIKRLERSIETAFQEGAGHGEFFEADLKGKISIDKGGAFSQKGGCPVCGYSFSKLDSRYFSANSLGRCTKCNGLGELNLDEDSEDVNSDSWAVCDACQGTGIKKEVEAIRINGASIIDLQLKTISELHVFIKSLLENSPRKELQNNPAFNRIVIEIESALQRLQDVGLDYLHLARRIRSLSGGEAQRVKLAGILTEALRGVLYILDEPSQGLHPEDLHQVWQAIVHLKSNGNTVIIIDHDPFFMKFADWIVDLGPGGGKQGGKICASFVPEKAFKFRNVSLTAEALAKQYYSFEKSAVNKDLPNRNNDDSDNKFINLTDLSLHNLKVENVKFCKNKLNVVTGVSGAGKTSLVMGTFVPNLISWMETSEPNPAIGYRALKEMTGISDLTSIQVVDRKPIAKSSVSMPATYLDVFTDIRNLYAKVPGAQIAGLTTRSFSLSVEGGRCSECKGRGEVVHSMRFLADARVKCPVCDGRRYKDFVLSVKYLGKTISEVLEMTLNQVYELFKNHKKIVRKLQPAIDLGLGYLKIGQPSSSLSGGEAQRLKLAPILAKQYAEGTVLVLDEPTQGLHFLDVEKLLNVLATLKGKKATLIIIEHNQAVIKNADWVIELGPGSGPKGGNLQFQGHPSGLVNFNGESATARHYFQH